MHLMHLKPNCSSANCTQRNAITRLASLVKASLQLRVDELYGYDLSVNLTNAPCFRSKSYYSLRRHRVNLG
jgi:hypothetical protein